MTMPPKCHHAEYAKSTASSTPCFRNPIESRRISLGLVANPPGKGVRSLLVNDGQTRDVKEHFYITDKGREYLKFRNAAEVT